MMRKENQQIYLENVAKVCEQELDALGIPYAKGITYSVNRRAKKRWGQCHRESICGVQVFSINISERLVDPSKLVGLKHTIHHELIHSAPRCFNHGREWKRYASMVNAHYGYEISRCASAEQYGFEKEEIEEVNHNASKYVFVCEGCGQTIYRQKASKFTKHPEWYHCGCCGSKFKRVK